MSVVRILHFPGVFMSGGVETVLLNWYKNIDKTKIQFDFCVSRNYRCPIDETIESLGGRVFYIPRIKQQGIIETGKAIERIIKEYGPYNAVHIHSVHAGMVALYYAKKTGVKKRIYHVHSTQDLALNSQKGRNVIELFSKRMINRLSTVRIACSHDAGNYIYGPKSNYIVVNNAIDLGRFFPFTDENMEECRNRFGLRSTDKVVGYVARFVEGKNHALLLDIAEIAKAKNIALKFLLVGDGPLKKQVEEQIVQRDLQQYFCLTGLMLDTENAYNAMDVFCVPSYFEGLSLVTVEAQACGLPCLISDGVPVEVDMGVTDIMQKKLTDVPLDWLNAIEFLYGKKKTNRQFINNGISQKGYNIKDVVFKLELLYLT